MLKVPDNVYFVCGMHGSGKTTLCREIMKETFPGFRLIRYRKCKMTSFEKVVERQIRRIARFGIDYLRIIDLAKKNPNDIILCDRSIYDGICYVKAFHKLKYTTLSEYRMLMNMVNALWGFKTKKKENKNGKCIYLSTPFAQIKRNLLKRQKEVGIRWNEKNMSYAKAVWHAYQNFFKTKTNCRIIISHSIEENVQALKKIIIDDRLHTEKEVKCSGIN